MKFYILATIILCISILTQINTQTEEELGKKRKALACSKLMKLRIKADYEHVNSIVEFISVGASKEEALNRLVSLIMLDCYNQMSEDNAIQVLKDIKYNSMNPMSSEYKPLIPLEKWEEIFQSSDENRLNEEVSSLRYAMEELKSQDLSKELEEENEIPLGNDDLENMNVGNGKKNIDFNLFGVNINELSSGVKYFVSFIFIVLLFGAIIYGLIKIKSFDRQVKSKVKKDKKN